MCYDQNLSSRFLVNHPGALFIKENILLDHNTAYEASSSHHSARSQGRVRPTTMTGYFFCSMEGGAAAAEGGEAVRCDARETWV